MGEHESKPEEVQEESDTPDDPELRWRSGRSEAPDGRRLRHGGKHLQNMAAAARKDQKFVKGNNRLHTALDCAQVIAESKGDREAMTGGFSSIAVRKAASKSLAKSAAMVLRLGGRALTFQGHVCLDGLFYVAQQIPLVGETLDQASEMVAQGVHAGLCRLGLADDDSPRAAPVVVPPGPPRGGAGGGEGGSYGGVDLTLRYNPPLRSTSRSSRSGSNLLCFDQSSGLLFQWAPGSDLAFTDFEMSSALQWVQTFGHRSHVAFSLDPIDPQKHEAAGDCVDGLYHAKWYSHESLKAIPLGYWMWRADWKLKQLTQGALYDDATKKQEPLRPGINIPADYPDAFESRGSGRRRCWIVCRGITLRPVGSNILVLHPEDVRMGVEERAMFLNRAKNTFEDSAVQPREASPEVQYLDRNYDAVARFHPELLHCKRMAMLLAVANYLHQGPLQGKASAFTTETSTIPKDFGDHSVPVLKVHHQKGLPEKAMCDRRKREVEELKPKVEKAEALVEELRRQYDQIKHRLDHQPVDRYSEASVDAYNRLVHEANTARDQLNSQVEIHSSCIHHYNAAVTAANEAVEVYNKTNSSWKVIGGVDLEVRKKVEMKPMTTEEEAILKYFRPVALEICEHPETATLLTQKHMQYGSPSVLQDILNQREVDLNVWPLLSRPVLGPVRMAKALRVVLHSLQRADLNGSYALLHRIAPVQGRYEVEVETGATIKVKRGNFSLLSPVRLFGLSDGVLNGQIGQIEGVQGTGTSLRYVVRLPTGKTVAVLPKNALLPVGSVVSLTGLESASQNWDNGVEVTMTKVFPPEWEENYLSYKERKCMVELPSGESLKLKVSRILI